MLTLLSLRFLIRKNSKMTL